MDLQSIKDGFARAFGDTGEGLRFFYAPGRVNLIGEHLDYNGGYVFPCALNLGIYSAARKRGDSLIRLASGNMEPKVTVDSAHIFYDTKDGWANYPKAVIHELLRMGYTPGGFDLYVWGDMPNNAGLSSSAAIELLTCAVSDRLFDLGVGSIERAKLCQRAENGFVGVNCGIMDQFASGMGKKDNAILLDCSTLEYQYVPLKLGDYRLIISNTNKKRGLTDSKYNERREECERALHDLQKVCDIKNLCDLSADDFEKYKNAIGDSVACNRAAHAVYENARTKAAVKALNTGNLREFGKLMNLSHVSLRDLYGVSCTELDVLAEAAWNVEGVLGSRMTGAGFGGCTVSVVHKDAADSFIKNVGETYKTRTGLTADFYIAETGDGAGEIIK
ncbi:MAG: galactokinase [Clostridiales bacterium]|jgi:galactokinase|nr:galactokinase [Clostridiales bacterium]